MADIEVLDNFKGLTKNKKTLLFAGLGLAAGVVVLAVRGAGGNSEEAMVVEEAEKDQSVSVLGSQMAAFENAVKQNQDSITSQLDRTTEAYEALTEDFADYQKSSEDKLLALQTAAKASQDSLVAQLIKLQNKQSDLEDELEDYQQPAVKKTTSSSKSSVSKNLDTINKTAGAIMNDLDKNVARMNTKDSRWGSAGDEQTAKNRYYASGGTDKEAARVLGY